MAGLLVTAFLLSPVLLIFAVPVAVGVGLDLVGRFGEMPVALAFCCPAAFVLLRRLLPVAPMVAWVRARCHPGDAGARDHAAKSIS